jgi:hypothetical protein
VVDSLLEQQKLPTGTAPPGKRSKPDFRPVVLRSIFEHLRESRPEGRLLQGGLPVGLLYAGKPNWDLLPTITPR